MTRWHHPKELDDLNEVGGHCPRCGAEYRPGFTECADCGVPLLPGPTPERTEEPAADVERDFWDRPVDARPEVDFGSRPTEPAEIATLPFEQAWLLSGRLRADGIPATVYPPTRITAGYGQASLVTASLHAVLVPKELAEEAAEAAKPYLSGARRPDG